MLPTRSYLGLRWAVGSMLACVLATATGQDDYVPANPCEGAHFSVDLIFATSAYCATPSGWLPRKFPIWTDGFDHDLISCACLSAIINVASSTTPPNCSAITQYYDPSGDSTVHDLLNIMDTAGCCSNVSEGQDSGTVACGGPIAPTVPRVPPPPHWCPTAIPATSAYCRSLGPDPYDQNLDLRWMPNISTFLIDGQGFDDVHDNPYEHYLTCGCISALISSASPLDPPECSAIAYTDTYGNPVRVSSLLTDMHDVGCCASGQRLHFPTTVTCVNTVAPSAYGAPQPTIAPTTAAPSPAPAVSMCHIGETCQMTVSSHRDATCGGQPDQTYTYGGCESTNSSGYSLALRGDPMTICFFATLAGCHAAVASRECDSARRCVSLPLSTCTTPTYDDYDDIMNSDDDTGLPYAGTYPPTTASPTPGATYIYATVGACTVATGGSTTLATPTLTPTTAQPTTLSPTTPAPATFAPVTYAPTVRAPTTVDQIGMPTTFAPTVIAPTSVAPTSNSPTTMPPTAAGGGPTVEPSDASPRGSGSVGMIVGGVVGAVVVTLVAIVVVKTAACRSTSGPKYKVVHNAVFGDDTDEMEMQ
eukprot:m.215913 g.215913  ORF g.215913 m.215913 type:complete len:589 (+) comp15544_c0_seq9:122-1888(+)